LKKQGYIESFENPHIFPSENREKYERMFPDYQDKIRRIRELHDLLPPSYSLAKHLAKKEGRELGRMPGDRKVDRIEEEMEKLEGDLKKLKNFMDENYTHPFTVNEKKLLGEENGVAKGELSYDERIGALNIINKTVKISEGRDSNQHHLLITLLKNRNKIWAVDEIWEDWGNSEERPIGRKIYNAARDINEKVAIQAGIKDFLYYNMKEVGIRREYM